VEVVDRLPIYYHISLEHEKWIASLIPCHILNKQNCCQQVFEISDIDMPSQNTHDDFDLKAKIRAKVKVIAREPCWEHFIYQLGVFLREFMRDHAELDEVLLKNQVERFEREKVGKGHLEPSLVDALSRSSAMRKLLPERAWLDWNVNCIILQDPGHIHLACAKMILLWTFLLDYDLATLENEILRVNHDKWVHKGPQAETVRYFVLRPIRLKLFRSLMWPVLGNRQSR